MYSTGYRVFRQSVCHLTYCWCNALQGEERQKAPPPSIPYTHSAAFATDQNSQIADWQHTLRGGERKRGTARDRVGHRDRETDRETLKALAKSKNSSKERINTK